MIRVKFEENGKEICLSMEGHANYGTAGKDVICAAASMLAYTAAQTVSYLHELGELISEPELRLEKGDVRICVHPREEYYAEVLYALSVCRVGYGLLARNYPENVELIAVLG